MTYLSNIAKDDYLSVRALLDTDTLMTIGWPTSSPSRASKSGVLGAGYDRWGKRAFDIVVASMMLVALAPLVLLLMLVVGLEGGQPIFGHTRVGQYGRRFKCLKIRSMRRDAEERLREILANDPAAAAEWAANAKLENDPRITRIGAFLRRTSLDELPQLINVLRGDMSLVGPRPVTSAELVHYGTDLDYYLAMKSGLTGPWQVQGRNDNTYEERVALDVAYARNHGFLNDFKIVLLTGLAVLNRTGK